MKDMAFNTMNVFLHHFLYFILNHVESVPSDGLNAMALLCNSANDTIINVYKSRLDKFDCKMSLYERI